MRICSLRNAIKKCFVALVSKTVETLYMEYCPRLNGDSKV